MYIETSYILYLTISIAMTVWVAHTLSTRGRLFLVEKMGDELADAVNHMLVVGFYLVNLGYILLSLETHQNIATIRQVIELLSNKVGFVMFFLGFFHLMNVYIVNRWGKPVSEQFRNPAGRGAREYKPEWTEEAAGKS